MSNGMKQQSLDYFAPVAAPKSDVMPVASVVLFVLAFLTQIPVDRIPTHKLKISVFLASCGFSVSGVLVAAIGLRRARRRWVAVLGIVLNFVRLLAVIPALMPF